MIVDRIDDERHCRINPVWSPFVVVCIACGPSLTKEQIEIVHRAHVNDRVRVITINDAYLWAPWSDIEYFADAKFWRWHTEGIAKPALNMTAQQVARAFREYAGIKLSIDVSRYAIADDRVGFMKRRRSPGWGISTTPTEVETGKHSGFQALNIALLSGARKVLLLGYDARPVDEKQRTHFHGGHPTPTPIGAYANYLRAYAIAEHDIKRTGVDVVNCSPTSAIGAFRKSTIEMELDETSSDADTRRGGAG